MTESDFGRLVPVALGLFAFLLGSIPFGLIVARLFKVKDLTERGSGNIGATNVSRVLGFWPAGALTFALDLLKGALPVLAVLPEGSRLWMGAFGLPETELSEAVRWAVGLFAVLGHCYSPWLHFKGGKGVATGFGAVLVLSPLSGLAGLVAFGVTFLSTRIGSLSSLSGLIVASVCHLVFEPIGAHLWAGALLVFVILIRHEVNIDALLDHRESAF